MPKDQKYRLIKVATELGVGHSTIVHFLEGIGIYVDSNPNTNIDQKTRDILYSEYKKDQQLKKNVQNTQLPDLSNNEIFSIDEKRQYKNLTEIKITPEKNQERPVIVGKIDLNPKNKYRNKPYNEPRKETKVEPPVIQPPKKIEPVEEIIPEKINKPRELQEHKIKVKDLKGVTLINKIEIEPSKKQRHKPEKPPNAEADKNLVASSSQENIDKLYNKKKRKRIFKHFKDDIQDNTINVKKDLILPPKEKIKKLKKDVIEEINEDEIDKGIKSTLSKLSDRGKSKTVKYRKEKRESNLELQKIEDEKLKRESKIIKVSEFLTVNELSVLMEVPVNEIIKNCFSLGIMVSINQRLDSEMLSLLASEYGFSIQLEKPEEENIETISQQEDPKLFVERPPIIVVMGHVDHGKTSFLDYIRKTEIVKSESGGITQHIGAYSITLKNDRKITFLDTPGHEAFTAMRARGAKITDIAVILISAEDSIMPQTVEAINHAKAANVTMIFAFNKIDKPGANIDRVKEQLSKINILVEDWGGEYLCQGISSKTGEGIPDLLEKILILADLKELKENPNTLAKGTVLEAKLDSGRGFITHLIVQKGTLKIGDYIVAGTYYGKIKAMFNDKNQKINSATPSTPVEILGMNGAPQAGDSFFVTKEEYEAKSISTKRSQLKREQSFRTKKHITLDEIGRRIDIGDFNELNIIIKGDVDGSIEALSDSLQKLSTDKVKVNIIHKSVGKITTSDVDLATVSDAIIIGFQVRPTTEAREIAQREEIQIKTYYIIYEVIEDVKNAMEGLLKPKIEEKIVCEIEVREVFKVSKIGSIAGCMVKSGKVNRNTKVRLIRDNVVIYTGGIGSLKRFKDDVKEVVANHECGIMLNKFNDINSGDIIEGYEEIEIKQKLS